MNKLSSRLDKLFKRMHVFFSAKDFRLIHDYLQVRLEAPNPDPYNPVVFRDLFADSFTSSFTSSFTGFNAPERESKKSRQERKFKEFIKKSTPSSLVSLQTVIENELKQNPKGVWLPKRNSGLLIDLLGWAKDHFAKETLTRNPKVKTRFRLRP